MRIDYDVGEMFYTIGCECEACKKFYSLIHPDEFTTVFFGGGGHCDPRRYYLESEKDFLERVPDGVLRWPEDHKPPKNLHLYFRGTRL